MQNFDLLKALGKIDKPVLLKRGLANTIEEWIMAAEYIMASGLTGFSNAHREKYNTCRERGIRTFEKYTRNTLDLSVVPIIKERTHLPIIIRSVACGRDWKLVEAMSLAAIAAGADGLIIEVHACPECAWSDGAQSLKPAKFASLIEKGPRDCQGYRPGIIRPGSPASSVVIQGIEKSKLKISLKRKAVSQTIRRLDQEAAFSISFLYFFLRRRLGFQFHKIVRVEELRQGNSQSVAQPFNRGDRRGTRFPIHRIIDRRLSHAADLRQLVEGHSLFFWPAPEF